MLPRGWVFPILKCVTFSSVSPASDMLPTMRRLILAAADERLDAIRDNLELLMARTGHDAVAIQALTGISAGTVRNFLKGTDSSVRNVLVIAQALGVSLADVERPPAEFRRLLADRGIV